jgi:hypothetical protein
MITMFMTDEYCAEFRTFDSDRSKPVKYFPCGKTGIHKKFRFSGLYEERITLAATGKKTNTQAPSQLIAVLNRQGFIRYVMFPVFRIERCDGIKYKKQVKYAVFLYRKWKEDSRVNSGELFNDVKKRDNRKYAHTLPTVEQLTTGATFCPLKKLTWNKQVV